MGTNKPDYKVWYYGISIAGWNNEKGISFKKPVKQYKDKESGEYKESLFFFDSDIPKLAAAYAVLAEDLGKSKEIVEHIKAIRQDRLKK